MGTGYVCIRVSMFGTGFASNHTHVYNDGVRTPSAVVHLVNIDNMADSIDMAQRNRNASLLLSIPIHSTHTTVLLSKQRRGDH